MKVCQINLNKSKPAYDCLFQSTQHDSDVGLYLIQEPPFCKGKLKAPKGFKMYGTSECRAIIIARSEIPLFLCNEFSQKDYTVVLFDDNTGNKRYFASIYLDQKMEVCSANMHNMCEFFTINNCCAIIGMDSNCHSVSTGSENNNARGNSFDDMCSLYNLQIFNVGKTPTFVNNQYSTIIDVTLGINVYDVTNWEVLPTFFLSDHKCIQFTVAFGEKVSKPKIKRINWVKFKEQLRIEDRSYYIWSHEIIEREAHDLVTSIQLAIDNASYTTSVKNATSAHFWTSDLNKSLIEVRKHFSVWEKHPTEATREKFVESDRSFKKELRKAKRSSWKTFTESVNDPKSMALLNKAIKNKASEQLGLLTNRDGTKCQTPEESLTVLMSEHFPDSIPISIDRYEKGEKLGRNTTFMSESSDNTQSSTNSTLPLGGHDNIKWCHDFELNDSFISLENTIQAIHSFKPHKVGGGSDRFKPRVLQALTQPAYRRLTRLFQAMVKLNYTPLIWRQAQVVFIPKPGKDDYSNPRAWRPISLYSFFVKTVEKLVLWELQSTVLKNKPFEAQQHGFTQGRSCDTALSSLVDKIESSILRNKLALVGSLDIQGAFDYCQHSAILDAMAEKRVPAQILGWYKHFLTQRYSITQMHNTKCAVRISRGTPQGGILSPLAFNLVFDAFIRTMNNGPVKVQAFADDAALLVLGVDPTSMVDVMQRALNKAANWGISRNLIFVPEKTNVIFFHRRKNWTEPKRLRMGNITLEYKSVIKFLGIWLDTKLNFNHHVQQKIDKARRHLFLIRKAIGTLWGPSPKALKWAYNGIVLPGLCYGSVIWARTAQLANTRAKLERLNRLAAVMMMPVRKRTPTSGMEVILGLPPVDLRIKEHALKTMVRILPHHQSGWDGVGNSNSLGHIRWGQNTLRNLGIDYSVSDKTNALNLNRKFMVDVNSFSSGLPSDIANLTCYTDGSKMTKHAGYGFCITDGDELVARGNGQLSESNTVFQAEIMAIHKLCEELLELGPPRATIYSDSQAAIKSLISLRTESKTVHECIQSLNLLGRRTDIEIKWIKAHSDHCGNEYADMEAKSGTSNNDNQVQLAPPISWSKMKIKLAIQKEWAKRWENLEMCEQTKIWLPHPNQIISRLALTLTRPELGLFVQMITGHNFLNKHEAKINLEVDPTCRFCGEERETSFHIIGTCPSFWRVRRECFETHELDSLSPEWQFFQFLKFLRLSKMKELNNRTTDNPDDPN